MNTPPAPPPTDPTLTFLPHIVSVVTGLVSGFLVTKLGLDANTSAQVAGSIGALVGSLATTVVHWGLAKLSSA